MTVHPFVEELKKVRKGLGYRQIDVAEHIGVTDVTFSYWETGKSVPTFQSTSAWAEFLKYRFALVEGPEEWFVLTREKALVHPVIDFLAIARMNKPMSQIALGAQLGYSGVGQHNREAGKCRTGLIELERWAEIFGYKVVLLSDKEYQLRVLQARNRIPQSH